MEPEKKKGKCKFCGKPIKHSCIRCYDCDVVWNDGVEFGKEEIKGAMREIAISIKILFGLL